jgi:hypothetical protein
MDTNKIYREYSLPWKIRPVVLNNGVVSVQDAFGMSVVEDSKGNTLMRVTYKLARFILRQINKLGDKNVSI